MPPALKVALASLGSPVTHEAFQALMETMGGSLAELAQAIHMHASCVDVSEFSLEELRSVMSRAFQEAEEEVLVLWPSDRVAARLIYQELVEHIDDLYYPGMDDLLIIEERQGVQRVLLLDHEERLHTAFLECFMQHSK